MDEMFEIGKNYVFYFYYGGKAGFQQSGRCVGWRETWGHTHPL